MNKKKIVSHSSVKVNGTELPSQKYGKLSDAEYKALWKKHPMKKNGKDYIPKKLIKEISDED